MSEPLDGEIIPPNGKASQPPAKGGKGEPKGKGDHKGYGRTSPQTPEQKKAEDEAAAIYRQLAKSGGFDWRHADWEPSDKEREAVRILSFAGYTQEDIAFVGNLSVERLVKHFAYDLRAAKILAVGDLASRALARARDGDATLTMFILKTRGGSPWSEKAGQMKELGEAIVNAEPDTAKRKELVKTILDALGAAAKKPKAEATVNEGGK